MNICIKCSKHCSSKCEIIDQFNKTYFQKQDIWTRKNTIVFRRGTGIPHLLKNDSHITTKWWYRNEQSRSYCIFLRYSDHLCYKYLFIIYRGSYMSAHVLLILLNELGKRDKMRVLSSILSLFRSKFNKFNNTRARMLDSIYHMTLRLLWNLISVAKTS